MERERLSDKLFDMLFAKLLLALWEREFEIEFESEFDKLLDTESDIELLKERASENESDTEFVRPIECVVPSEILFPFAKDDVIPFAVLFVKLVPSVMDNPRPKAFPLLNEWFVVSADPTVHPLPDAKLLVLVNEAPPP